MMIGGADYTMLGPLAIMYPELIQLMDDDIVSVFGLMVLLNRSYESHPPRIEISQLSLSLYLMTQCQFKLRHSVASLSKTLDYIQFARFNTEQTYKCVAYHFGQDHGCIADQLVLKFVQEKILCGSSAHIYVDGFRMFNIQR